MNKILSFGRSCKAYLRLYEHKSPDVHLRCLDCDRTLHKHGRYFRSVTTKRETIRIPIYRWLCPDCRTTVSLLPDFLVPWARFTTWVREASVARKRQERSFRSIAETVTLPTIGLSTATVKRWWKQHLVRAASAALWVASQLTASGLEEDLIQMHPTPSCATPRGTAVWIQNFSPCTSPNTPIFGAIGRFLMQGYPMICFSKSTLFSRQRVR
jgi:transposase-like protein